MRVVRYNTETDQEKVRVAMSDEQVPRKFRLTDAEWASVQQEVPLDEELFGITITRESIEKDIFLEALEEALHGDFKLQLELYELIEKRVKP